MDRILQLLETRFWERVEILGPKDCWKWKLKLPQDGYPRFSLGSRGCHMKAHRFSLALKLKRLLRKGEQALHTCDNPVCVNPDHLFLGNHLVNMQDMGKKNRSRVKKKISDSQVLDIRKRYHAGNTLFELAVLYKTDRRNIQDYVKGKRRRYVGGPIHTEDMRKTRNGGHNKKL